MIEEIIETKDKSESKYELFFGTIDSFLKIVGALTVLFYVLGFFVWNIYLYGLRFEEIELLQTRFIYTGFLFSLNFSFWIFVFFILYNLLRTIFSISLKEKVRLFLIKTHIYNKISSILIFLFFILYLFYFSILRFPNIPRIFGGGKPIVTSLLLKEGQSDITSDYLKNFGIATASNIQSQQLCVAYENSNTILIILQDRVLQLNKSELNGTAPIPTNDVQQQIGNNYCKPLVGSWLMIGNNLQNYWLARALFNYFYGTFTI